MDRAKPVATCKADTNLVVLLDELEACFIEGKSVRAGALSDLFQAEAPGDPANRMRWHRARVLSQLQLDHMEEAEEENGAALRECPNNPDFAFFGCRIAYRMREYSTVLAEGKRCLALLQESGEPERKKSLFAQSTDWQARLREMIGEACEQMQDAVAAERWYDEGIVLAPTRAEGYRRLTMLQHRRHDLKKAEATLKKGLAQAADPTELRMMAESGKPHATISACMIVKNEEEQLPRCLDSIRDWVDEIVIVDTGSTDKTVEIAREYGARLFHQPWEGDFSKHRNHSLDQANGDWIFIVDADEEFCIEDLPKLRKALDDVRNEIVSIDVFNVYGQDQRTRTFLPSIRFFRRRLNLRYAGIVHNTLTLPQGATVARASVQLKHYGYDLTPQKMKQKFLRSKALLEKQLKSDPDNFFALFNYAQLLRGAGEETLTEYAPKIIKSAQRAVELTDPSNPLERHIHLMCLDQLGWVSMYLCHYDDAIRYAERAISLKPDYLDPLLMVGHVYARNQQFDKAETAYRQYLAVQEKYQSSRETENIIVMHVDSRAQAYYGLAIIAELRNRPEEALRWYEATVEANPDHLDANLNLARLLLSLDRPEDARRCYDRHLNHNPDAIEALLGLAYLERRAGRGVEAEARYHRVLALEPEQPVAMLKLGELQIESGRQVEGLKTLAELCRLHPEKSREAASLYLRVGKCDEARELFETWLEDHADDSALLTDLGNCYFKLGDLVRAEEQYQRATEMLPVTPGAFRNLGLVLARRGELAEALEAFERYLRLNGDDAEIRGIAVDLCFRCGQYAQALPHLETVVRSEPQNLGVLVQLSECYLQLGHTDAALAGYRHVLAADPENITARQRLAQFQTASVRS